MQKIVIACFLLFSYVFSAQITGKITGIDNKALATVSIYLENTVTGTTSNDNGFYLLSLQKKGEYTIVFQYLGYKTVKKKITITSFPYQLNVILEEEKLVLDEISISTKENPANIIIRKTIAAKEKNTDKYAKYTATFYSRGLYRIKNAPKRILGRNLGDFGGGLDSTRSGIIYLSETASEIAFQKTPKKFKEKIIASKVSGTDNGISFNRAEDANINFYNNSVDFGNALISPIATTAFSYYKYRLVGSFYDKNQRLINKIAILPKRINDPVFQGFLYIVEDDWALYGADVTVTGAQVNLPMVDELKLKQEYNFVPKNKAWVLISQRIDFKANFFGFKLDGKFSSGYSNYNFSPNFTKTTFTNEVLSFAKSATEKDVAFWDNLRPVPLTEEELKDYIKKDSIKTIRKSKKYLDSVDGIRNKFTYLSPITGYTFSNSYEKKSISYKGLIDDFSYNTVQGFNTALGVSYFKRQNDKGKWISFGAKANYGFSDERVRPSFYFTKKWNNFSKPRLSVSGGMTTPQFNERHPIFKLNNTIASLLYRKNYMKIYEKDFAKIAFSKEVKNGIYLSTSLEYANRKPLFNTTNYSIASEKNHKPFTSNNPLDLDDFTNPAFTPHEIAIFRLGTTFVFGQKYLSYPDAKFTIDNNNFPSLSIDYIKRFGASKGELNSDLFITNIRQDFKTGTYGYFAYHIRGGIFVKQKNIAFMDNLHANGNQLLFPIDRELNSFNLLDYYNYYTNDKYAELHVEHNFKGAVLSKIPLINKLNFHLILGAKGLVMADRNPYSEYSIGLDNVGFGKWRLLRFEYVTARYSGINEKGFVFRLNLP